MFNLIQLNDRGLISFVQHFEF